MSAMCFFYTVYFLQYISNDRSSVLSVEQNQKYEISADNQCNCANYTSAEIRKCVCML